MLKIRRCVLRYCNGRGFKTRGISAERPLVYISGVAYEQVIWLKPVRVISRGCFWSFDKRSQVAPQTEWKQIFGQCKWRCYFEGEAQVQVPSYGTGQKVDIVGTLIQKAVFVDHPRLAVSYTTSFTWQYGATFQNNTDYVRLRLAYKSDLLLDHSRCLYCPILYITDGYPVIIQGEVLTPKAWDRNRRSWLTLPPVFL